MHQLISEVILNKQSTNHFHYIVKFRVNDCKASKESSNQVHSLAALALEEGM